MITKKAMLLRTLSFYNASKTWAINNGYKQCDGNLDYFLWAIFSLYNFEKERKGMGKKLGTFENFDNVETQNKHEVSLGSCLFKMHLSFLKILAWVGFYHGEFL